jgi:integrase
MAIHIYCPKCYTSNGLDSELCSSCKTPFGKDRRYRVAVTIKGRRFTRVVDNLTIARELERTASSDLVREEFDITHHKAKKKMPTLGELWEKYLPWAKDHKKSWKDDEWYFKKHLEPRFSNKTLDGITSFDLEKLKGELKKAVTERGTPYAAQTIKHILVIVRRLYNLARKWGIYDGPNPVSSVKMPRIDNQVTEFLTDEELSMLLETLNNWPYDDSAAFIKFALFSGFRRGEIFKMQWSHVDFERGMVTLPDPKGKKTATVPICQEALDILQKLRRTYDFCFPGKEGKQRTDFKGPWQRIRKAAGLPGNFRFHGLRHHFASTLVSNGVDLAVVRELMTHKEMSTTLRYANLRPDAVKAVAQKVGQLLQPKKEGRAVVGLVK